MTTTNEMIEAVKAHALTNYGKGGWDYVVECYEDTQLEEIITEESCTTIEAAIQAVGTIVGIFEEQRFDAQVASGELEYYGIVEHEGKMVRQSDLD